MNDITTLIFDWGDTVMVDFPEYGGSMVTWPRVEAVEGISAALPRLAKRYRLALASNAAESGAGQVRAALERVGLEAYFTWIFTARELGYSKQDFEYYPLVLKETGCRPEQALMIGDGYATDVAAAKTAGMRAAWYNPACNPCPNLHPLHDLEVSHLEELVESVQKPLLPDIETCLDLLSEQKADEGLREHCKGVALAAYWTAAWLRMAGTALEPLLVHRGGLLHDLDKATSKLQGKPHGRYSSELLLGMGFPRLAEIAERHVIHKIVDAEAAPRTWEEKLVYYADKLVEGRYFVGVEKRLDALAGRYPGYAEQIERCRRPVLALEAEICNNLGLTQTTYYERIQALFKLR